MAAPYQAPGQPREWDADSYDTLPLPHERWGQRLLATLPLRGDETVLDVGARPSLLGKAIPWGGTSRPEQVTVTAVPYVPWDNRDGRAGHAGLAAVRPDRKPVSALGPEST